MSQYFNFEEPVGLEDALSLLEQAAEKAGFGVHCNILSDRTASGHLLQSAIEGYFYDSQSPFDIVVDFSVSRSQEKKPEQRAFVSVGFTPRSAYDAQHKTYRSQILTALGKAYKSWLTQAKEEHPLGCPACCETSADLKP